jgi:choline dehydrogenase-like flavoprotein
MIRKLMNGHGPEPLPCDVAIVGAGVAGLIMACEMARRGLRTIVLESGAMRQEADTNPLNRVIQTGHTYQGAEHGRFRCLGGTSTRWGGALLPFLEDDLRADTTPGRSEAWPVRLEELDSYLPAAERVFSLPAGPYEPPAAMAFPADSAFRPRAAKWPAFRRRNVARVLGATLRSPSGPQVWLNAHVTRLRLGENGRLSTLEATDPSGAHLTVSPKVAVLAAGAIESTRLLLKMDADYDRRLFGSRGVIGRYFHDHLSAPVATVRVLDGDRFDRTVGFRFQGPGMRNLRFELTGTERRRRGLPGAFAHVAFTAERGSAFDALREIYRAAQRGRLPPRADLALLAGNSGWLLRAAWSRWAERRVLPPDHARFEVHLVTEQIPLERNRITLSEHESDPYGVPLAQIHWHVSADDIVNTVRVRDAFAEFWSCTALAQLGELQMNTQGDLEEALSSGGGIYHPGGSLRMSTAPQSGVVDANLRTFAVPNLRIVSTATFPSGGATNPTMMLILFALRASADIARELGAQREQVALRAPQQ